MDNDNDSNFDVNDESESDGLENRPAPIPPTATNTTVCPVHTVSSCGSGTDSDDNNATGGWVLVRRPEADRPTQTNIAYNAGPGPTAPPPRDAPPSTLSVFYIKCKV